MLGGLLANSAFARPQITFFSQLQASELEGFFTDTVMLQKLQDLNASVVIGMVDFHPNRAKTIDLLNSWEIPVTAWLLLPKKDHYFLHAHNSEKARLRYEELKDWIKLNKLQVRKIGIGIEPDLKHLKDLEAIKSNALATVFRKLTQDDVYGEAEYQTLVYQMQSDGFEVESYIYPYLLENKSKGLRKLAGLVHVETDKEVPMIFSSHNTNSEQNLLHSYARTHNLKSVGIGSTGGDFSVHGIKAPESLNWDDTKLDLQTAYNFANDIYLFSLEGCAKQDMLEEILNMEWKKEQLVATNIAFLAGSPSDSFSILNYHPLDYPYISLAVFLLIATLTFVAGFKVLKKVFG